MLVRVNQIEDTSSHVLQLGKYSILLGCSLDVARCLTPDFTSLHDTYKFHCILLPDAQLTTCGGLPAMIHHCGYNGPVVMNHFARYMAPRLIQEYV